MIPKNKLPRLTVIIACLLLLAGCGSAEQHSGRDWYSNPPTAQSPANLASNKATVMVTGRVPTPGSYAINASTTLESILRQAGWAPGLDTGYSGVTTVIISRFVGNQEYEWVTRDEYVTHPDWKNFQLQNADIIKIKILIL